MTTQPLRDGFELSDTRRTLPIALLRLRERVMSEFRPMLASHGTTEQQWRVLRVLMEVEEIDASDLAARACILAPSLSRILKTLDARNFVAVERSAGDGRRASIRLTEEGERFIRAITPESAAIYARIEARIGRDRMQSLLVDLDEVLRALDEEPGT